MKAIWCKLRIYLLPIISTFLLYSCLEDTIEPTEFGSLSGVVMENESGKPLSDVEIRTSPPSNTIFTDSAGSFYFNQIQTGEYTLTASLTGYDKSFVNIKISTGTNSEVTVRMERIITVPGFPISPIPSSGSNQIERNVILRWSGGSNSEDSISYNVSVFESNVDTAVFKKLNTCDTFIELERLKYETTYFWQVIAISSSGDEVKSDLWNFSTLDFPDNRYLYIKNHKGLFQTFSSSRDSTIGDIQLTFENYNCLNPLFSNDRKEIAFSANSELDYQIYMMDFKGKSIRKITNLPVKSFHSDGNEFCWWPDNGGFIYSHYDKLYSIDRNGSNLNLLTTAPQGRHFGDCDYTDVGNKILVQTIGVLPYEGEIYLMNDDGTGLTQIVNDLPGVVQSPSFSIDGRKVIYTHDISGFESNDGRQLDSRIFILDLDSMQVRDISLNKPSGTNDLNPRFSPFGSQIIFTNALNDGSEPYNVYVMDLDGANRKLLFDNARMPDWK